MARTTPKPRSGRFYGMAISGTTYPNGTWLEDEAFAYPAGGFTRRAYARCEDGRTRVVLVSIPDTYFSIPARARFAGKYVAGFVTADGEDGVAFKAYAPKPQATEPNA